MKSPFPGMDPFIEGCGLWGDFHDALIQNIKNALGEQAPERYLVRTGERGYVVLASEEGEKRHSFIPDVNVTTGRSSSELVGAIAIAETAAEAKPYSLRAFIEDEFRETFVEILDADNESQLVTCIEVLSPSNKKPKSEGWELYLRKRQGLLRGRSANLIEIDLLRGGQRMPMVDPWPASPYTLLVARKARGPDCLVWPAYCVRRLSAIPVPLLKPDPDLSLDLQPMIDAIYTRSRYHRSINYTKPITPPLSTEETSWLAEQLKPRAGLA